MSRAYERALEVLHAHDHQRTPEPPTADTIEEDECWRCFRRIVVDDIGLCEDCAAWMADETGEVPDPAAEVSAYCPECAAWTDPDPAPWIQYDLQPDGSYVPVQFWRDDSWMQDRVAAAARARDLFRADDGRPLHTQEWITWGEPSRATNPVEWLREIQRALVNDPEAMQPIVDALAEMVAITEQVTRRFVVLAELLAEADAMTEADREHRRPIQGAHFRFEIIDELLDGGTLPDDAERSSDPSAAEGTDRPPPRAGGDAASRGTDDRTDPV